MFEQVNSNWHGIPPHSCLQCRLRPITLTLSSPLRARKYHAIRENSRGKWPTVSLPSTTFTACLSIGLSNSRLATSFLQSMASIRLDKHDIHAQLMRKQTFPCCVVTKLSFLYRSPALYFHSNSTVFISTVGFSNEDNCCQSGGIGNRLKRYFESLTY